MIKANELRIGNLIRLTGKSKEEIRVYKIHFELREGHLINGDIPEQYLEGIPLTEERLLKFGFENVDDEIDFSEFVLGDFRIFGNGSDKQEPFYFAYDYNGKEIRVELPFVHQLQNLFHSLKQGQELT